MDSLSASRLDQKGPNSSQCIIGIVPEHNLSKYKMIFRTKWL